MRQALVLTILGLSLAAIGLFLSPAPWLGFVCPGVALAALGLLKDFD
jgi:hypothetical protein